MSPCLMLSVMFSLCSPEQAWNFKTQEIDTGLGVGYAVLAVDLNNDGAKDLVVADKQKILAYYHPDWKRKVLLEGGTAPDNVCIAARDIDGDGKVDLALGAGWKPFDTKGGGTLQWLRQPDRQDSPWTVHPISSEPTVHRMRFAKVGKNGEEELVVIPLMGRDSSAKANWMDGSPLRVLAYSVPGNPAKDPWPVRVLNQDLHVAHNFDLVAREGGHDLVIASYEGVSLLSRVKAGDWRRELLHQANQENAKGNRGASEVRRGTLANGEPIFATVEPWHGGELVVYRRDNGAWKRRVLDNRLKWGHAIACVDLDGDGTDEIVFGIRDNLSTQAGEKCGVRIFSWDAKASEWKRHLLDEGGVAVEDLLAADLDKDGSPDLVAVGRATGNVRIYWNKR
ncbi:MAG: FG-GAP repeat domain-containing protein [Planctomycetota bacterium]